MNRQHDYQSPLRQEQVQRTREKIFEGLVQTLAQGGITNLSIPAVARAAGVSVPTIYRYFHTKQELVEALGSYLTQRSGIKPPPQLPRNPEELIMMMTEIFLKYEGADETLRAAIMSEPSYEARREALPYRLKMIEQVLAPVASNYSETDFKHLRDSVLILTTTAMVRAFKDYLDLTGADAAETVAWAIRTLTSSRSTTDEQTLK